MGVGGLGGKNGDGEPLDLHRIRRLNVQPAKFRFSLQIPQ